MVSASNSEDSHDQEFDWLAGDGEMGDRIRALDWSNTPIGSPAHWSPALRMMVRFLLSNRFPLLLWWGPHYVSIYNDAYRPVLGTKHPWGLGLPLRECWSEIWDVLKPLVDTPFHGGPATWNEDIQLEINRHGFVEETHFTVAYSPVPDESVASGIGGVLATVHEITEKILGERRAILLRDLGSRASEGKTAKEACEIAAETLARFGKDVPFAALYLIADDGKSAQLAGTANVEPGADIAPIVIDTTMVCDNGWPIAQAMRSDSVIRVEALGSRFATVPPGPWPDPPSSALLIPIPSNKLGQPVAVMIVGLSARHSFDDSYQDSLTLVKTQIATAIANAQNYDQERSRAEALAEIDRAKTAFFSNVSHEFRTPLTLMLGPLEEMRQEAGKSISSRHAEQLDLVYRNSLRLLKLTNTLLDFARIEAGRTQAVYEATDLSAFTVELASAFRSATEKAGLKLVVSCPPLVDPVFVDRDMWEKIVLNILSNAFKFTFAGEIAVGLHETSDDIVLTIRDTGTGIPAGELTKLFDRFHRVAGAQGRTHEGSGIGLALVQELVKLHGGSVTATSVLGKGSTFTVSLPKGKAHLPTAQIKANTREATSPIRTAKPFASEALRWLPDENVDADDVILDSDVAAPAEEEIHSRSRIIFADDNPDMRDYVSRLLARRYDVEAVADGQAALEAIARNPPDLLLSDIMMPRLDGFELLSRLRADSTTATLPVILMSARAGEEARVDGMQAGADDYLTKPFSARELLARVEAHIKMLRFRREVTLALQASEERFRAFVTASSDVVYRMSPDWREMHFLDGKDFIPDTHASSQSWLTKYIHVDDQAKVLDAINGAIASRSTFEQEHRVIRVDGSLGWTHSRAIPILDETGEITEWFGAARDITNRKEAEALLIESERRLRLALDAGKLGSWEVIVKDFAMTASDQCKANFGRNTDEPFTYEELRAAVHPDDRDRWADVVARAMTEIGEFDIDYRCRWPDDSEHWINARGRAIDDTKAGIANRIVGTTMDITARKQAEELQRLLTGELSHRVKNMLATVQAIATQTLRHNKNPGDFVTSFGGRIQSMSKIHSLLSSNDWKGADLRSIIHDQLLVGVVDESRVTAWGPRVLLEAQIVPQVAMMLHELGTNSIKYGALSRSSGTVTINWTVGDEQLHLRWAERGGPPVTAPAKRGFGTTLIEQSAKGAGGSANMSISTEGVHWEIELPLPRPGSDAASPSQQPNVGTAKSPVSLHHAGKSADRLAGKRFLVIEDEPLVALDVVDTLEQAGAQVLDTVGTISDALKVIESTSIDAALLDANLHGQPVDEIAAALTRKRVPFIFVSGYSADNLPRAFAAAPLLVKPFTEAQLTEAIARLVTGSADVRKLRE